MQRIRRIRGASSIPLAIVTAARILIVDRTAAGRA
jgi:hypothetical protein